MGIVKYFFDTYALYEFCNGNEKYKKYFEKYEIITTQLNLIELFYALLRSFGIEKAREYYKLFSPFIVNISEKIVEKSMEFKLVNEKERLSYADCIGYIFSKENNLKFLTGDQQFKDKINVEYIK